MMHTVIEQWMKDKLGIILKEDQNIGSFLKNGKVIAMLLEKYGIITELQLNTIVDSKNVKESVDNLKSLKKWLSLIDMNVKENELQKIAEGENATILRFLYELYLKLEEFSVSKNKIYNEDCKQKAEVLVVSKNICNALGEDETEHYNDRQTGLRNKFKMIGEKYCNIKRSECVHNIDAPESKLSKKCGKLENVIREIENFEWTQSNQQRLSNTLEEQEESPYYFDNVKNQKSFKDFQKQMMSETVQEPVEAMQSLEEKIFLNRFVEKLTKQSQKERQMCEMMNRLRHQQKILLENKRLMDKITEEQRGRSLMALAEKFEKNLQENILKSQKEAEENRRKEEQIIRNRLMYNECAAIVKNLICLALKISKFKNVHVPKELWQLWKQEFIKDECVSEDLSDVEDLLEEGYSDVTHELDRQETLVNADLYDYLHFQRDWLADFCSLPAQDVLGFIVTKLLALLSPNRIPPKKVHLPDFNIAVCLHGIPENFYSLMKQVFERNDIALFTVEEILNTVVLKYKRETAVSEIANDVSHASEAKNRSEYLVELEQIESTTVLTKETQTPAILPEPDFAELSSTTEIGKVVAEKLIYGHLITPDLTVKALLSYLKETPQLKGWVLLNFPTHENELFELESNLTGQLIPLKKHNSYNILSEILELRSKLVPYRVNMTNDEPFSPYITHFIYMKVESASAPEPGDMISISQFYTRFGRYKEVVCNQVVNLEHVQSVIRYILSNLDKKFLDENISQIFKDIDLQPYLVKKTSKGKMSKRSKDFFDLFDDGKANYEPDANGGEIFIGEHQSEISFTLFADFDAPMPSLISLGEIWQNMENHYLEALKNIFFVKRKEHSKMILFGDYINSIFDKCLTDFSNKQVLVDKFLTEFNNVSQTDRSNLDMKSALHRRVFEFQNTLWEICDENMRQREETIHLVLESDWFIDHLNTIIDHYLLIINEEVQRHVDTMQLLTNYYLLSLEKSFILDKLEIKCKRIDITRNNHPSLQSCIQYQNDEGFIVSFQSLHKPINAVIEYYKRQMDALNKNSIDFSKLTDNIRGEMESAIADEKSRISLRMMLIEKNMFDELKNFEIWYSVLLNNQFEKLKLRYENEVESVNSLSKVLTLAIEEEMSLPYHLYLKEDTFYIDSRNVQKSMKFLSQSKPLPLTVKPLNHSLNPDQIENLRHIFQNVAPLGVVLNNVFVLVLQDIQAEENLRHCLSESWRHLDGGKLKIVVKQLFGITDFCDWKDFIIHAFEMSFPSSAELVNLSKVFKRLDKNNNELIYLDDYSYVTFWFEKDLPESPEFTLKAIKFKEILFRLFQVDEYRTNYSNLLFHLCKDENPLQGVAKAMSVVCGQEVHVEWTEDISSSDVNEADLYSNESQDNVPLSKITYKTFHKVMAGNFQFDLLPKSKLPEGLEDCLEVIKSKFVGKNKFVGKDALCKVYDLLHEPCFYKFLHSVHKFKAVHISEIISLNL